MGEPDTWAKNVGPPVNWIRCVVPIKRLYPLFETRHGDYYQTLTGQIFFRGVAGIWEVAVAREDPSEE